MMYRTSLFLFLLALPSWALPMTFDETRHLLSRTGFGGTPQEIAYFRTFSYEDAVDQLLNNSRPTAQTPAPRWANDPPPDFRKLRILSDQQKKTFRRQRRQRAMELKAWWYREMIDTDSALSKRMTLFWHNHFTSGLRKVRWPQLMYRQNQLLRRHALANFRELLRAIARDPAMVVYLDNQSNRKGNPNENFARELLELFTLGEGRYSEQDVKETARAFTGWMVNRSTGVFHFNRRRHDFGPKTFMGETGRFDGNDIIDIILARRRVAEHISEKLWREFISETPNKVEISRLAAVFRDHDYALKPLLREIFLSSHFRAAHNIGTQIKSPVELLVGTVRMFDLPVRNVRQLVRAGRLLGQDIFDPPNVKGWPSGKQWINSDTLLARQEILRRALRAMEMGGMRRYRHEDSRLPATTLTLEPAELKRVLLPMEPVNALPIDGDRYTQVGHLVLDPAYQLK